MLNFSEERASRAKHPLSPKSDGSRKKEAFQITLPSRHLVLLAAQLLKHAICNMIYFRCTGWLKSAE
jgi:hypothetical protein